MKIYFHFLNNVENKKAQEAFAHAVFAPGLWLYKDYLLGNQISPSGGKAAPVPGAFPGNRL